MADTKNDPTETSDTVPENAPDTIGTPEGDNEYPPDEPLTGTQPDIARPAWRVSA